MIDKIKQWFMMRLGFYSPSRLMCDAEYANEFRDRHPDVFAEAAKKQPVGFDSKSFHDGFMEGFDSAYCDVLIKVGEDVDTNE